MVFNMTEKKKNGRQNLGFRVFVTMKTFGLKLKVRKLRALDFRPRLFRYFKTGMANMHSIIYIHKKLTTLTHEETPSLLSTLS